MIPDRNVERKRNLNLAPRKLLVAHIEHQPKKAAPSDDPAI